MSKSSTVTVRETPVQQVTSAAAGGLVIHGESFVIDTDDRIELVDLTDRVMDYVRRVQIREGMITLWSMHTTCALFINESRARSSPTSSAFSKTWSRATAITCTTIRSTPTAIA